MIKIELCSALAVMSGMRRAELEIGESVSLEQLTARLGISADAIGILIVNNKWASPDSVIRDGDSVQLYPVMDGG